jgi:peptide/nickel transport system substrate-binding protein
LIVDVPPDNVAQVKADTQLRFIAQPGPHIWWLAFNLSKPPFNDRRVRQAAVQAINKEAIVRDILKGTATVASGPIPPAIDWAYTPEVQTYPYDPVQAKKLLADAGYAGGVDVVLWIPESGSGM